MRGDVAWQLAAVGVLLVAGCTGGSAGKVGDAKQGLLHLKVDFAAPSGHGNLEPIAATAKPGWWHWVVPDWDFYRCDLAWENGRGVYPQGGSGIAGSGVHAAITCHYEGIMSIHVAGMKRYLAGGIKPEKQPIYEPICNSWVAGSDFPNSPASDVLLALYDLPAGKYRLVSYHNSFNCRRIGDDPTGVECAETGRPEPPMASIKVYPVKHIVEQYYQAHTDAEVKGRPYGTAPDKLIVAGREGTGNVRQTLEARNVVIQQVKTDAELQPSVIEFVTDGSAVVVVYTGGCCKGDDLRRHRKGGYAVLNAFELIQLSAETAGR